MRIKRFNRLERLLHLGLMLSFLIQSATGLSRMFITTSWGKSLSDLFGGYEAAFRVHQTVGILMIIGFLLNLLYLFSRIDWTNFGHSIWGPDSLVPNLEDARHLGQRIRWFFGGAEPPRLNRWAYWEKFDYWAVFWGLPLLAVTGLMLMYPIETSRIMPGWSLNIAVLLHQAEAILAMLYIFIVHFYVGHLRPSAFPMNEAMFAGSVPIDDLREEKPAWVERLQQQPGLQQVQAQSPSSLYRVVYTAFGYMAVLFGVYLLINGIIYSQYIRLH